MNLLITEAQKDTWDDHLVDYNNPHRETAKQVGSLRSYLSLEELNKTVTTPLEEVVEAMEIPSELICSIETENTTIYPALTGELILRKSALDTGSIVFLAGNGEVFISTFNPIIVVLETSTGEVLTTSANEEIRAQV